VGAAAAGGEMTLIAHDSVSQSIDLIFNSFKRRCACGVGLIVGWDGRGQFRLTPGYNGDYGRYGEQVGYKYRPQAPDVRQRIEGRCSREETELAW
jgi:hypothetical protein